MHQIALIVALGATSGLFGHRQAVTTTCASGNCAASTGYTYGYNYYPQYVAPGYRPAPAMTQTAATTAPAPTAAPAPAAGTVAPSAPAAAPTAATPATAPRAAYYYAPAQAPAPAPAQGYYYYYYPTYSAGCPNGTCYRR